MTGEKLYSLVKSGVREYLYASTSHLIFQLIQSLIAAEGFAGAISRLLTYVSNTMRKDVSGNLNNLVDIRFSYILDGRVIAGVQTGAFALEAELSRLPSTPLTTEGDKYVVDGNRLMIKIAETAVSLRADVSRPSGQPPRPTSRSICTISWRDPWRACGYDSSAPDPGFLSTAGVRNSAQVQSCQSISAVVNSFPVLEKFQNSEENLHCNIIQHR